MIKLIQGDCLEVMKVIPDKSIDAIICDLPYGTTACKWDSIIPFEPLWEQYKRIIKDNGAIVLTASQPFTSALVMSNPKWFKYEWIWNKKAGGNFLNANRTPLAIHESVLVFYKKFGAYNPQMTIGKTRSKGGKKYKNNGVYGDYKEMPKKIYNQYYPKSIIDDCSNSSRKDRVHPTQKPVALMEYLVKTYTNQGDTVLDNCMGSGTTGLACKNLGRKFISIEQDANYFEIAKTRIG